MPRPRAHPPPGAVLAKVGRAGGATPRGTEGAPKGHRRGTEGAPRARRGRVLCWFVRSSHRFIELLVQVVVQIVTVKRYLLNPIHCSYHEDGRDSDMVMRAPLAVVPG